MPALSSPLLTSLDGVNADKARALFNVDGKDIVVAVLDSGCNASHRAFAVNRVLAGHNFTDPVINSDTTDSLGHGTATSVIIAGNQPFAPVVIAPSAMILPLKVVADD